jgi:hypothetical protein
MIIGLMIVRTSRPHSAALALISALCCGKAAIAASTWPPPGLVMKTRSECLAA